MARELPRDTTVQWLQTLTVFCSDASVCFEATAPANQRIRMLVTGIGSLVVGKTLNSVHGHHFGAGPFH